MENRYVLYIDESNNIIKIAYTFHFLEDSIEISYEEYEKAKKYRKFNPKTREFSDVIESAVTLTNEERMGQLEEALGVLAEQSAKQSLGM